MSTLTFDAEATRWFVKPSLPLALVHADGSQSVESVEQAPKLWRLTLARRNLVGVGDMAQLEFIVKLDLSGNKLSEVPASVLAMQWLRVLVLAANLIEDASPIGVHLANLTHLHIENNLIRVMPAFGHLELEWLNVRGNRIAAFEAGFFDLCVKFLLLAGNPCTLDGLPRELALMRKTPRSKPGSAQVDEGHTIAHDSFAALLRTIRREAFELLVGLQPLFLPALLLVEIVDEAVPNTIPMHKKWDLVVAVKHWRQRHGIER